MKTTEIYQIFQVVPNYSTKEREHELHICQVAEVVHWHGVLSIIIIIINNNNNKKTTYVANITHV